MVPECIDAVKYLQDECSISCDLIDLYSIRPWDKNTLVKSVAKTKKLLCVDTAAASFSVSSEIISSLTEEFSPSDGIVMRKIGLPDVPEPTSYALTKDFYLDADDVIQKVLKMCDLPEIKSPIIRAPEHHDVPGSWFKGPF